MKNLVKPMEVFIDTEEGQKAYIISRFPSVKGREILAKYPLSSLPKLGDYKTNEETMFEAMKYVAVKMPNGTEQRLSNADLIDNHTDSWETLVKLEKELITYNCSFFRDGRASNFLGELIQNLPQLVTKMLMGLLAQSSQAESPPTTN
jgi:hypothetical protein